MTNLGWLLRDLGDFAAARHLLERALIVRERVLGKEHAHTARTVYHLAVLLEHTSERVAAGRLHERALATLERTLGSEHWWTLDSRRALDSITSEPEPPLDESKPLT